MQLFLSFVVSCTEIYGLFTDFGAEYLDKALKLWYNTLNGYDHGSGAVLCPDFCIILQKTERMCL